MQDSKTVCACAGHWRHRLKEEKARETHTCRLIHLPTTPFPPPTPHTHTHRLKQHLVELQAQRAAGVAHNTACQDALTAAHRCVCVCACACVCVCVCVCVCHKEKVRESERGKE